MRKKVFGRQLSRDTKTRKALFRALVRSMVLYEKIETTQAKGKAIVADLDKVVNLAKEESTPSLRRLYAFLGNDKESVKKLTELAKVLKSRNGGYTRMIKLVNRRGDNSEMVRLEWVKDIVVEPKSKIKK